MALEDAVRLRTGDSGEDFEDLVMPNRGHLAEE